MERQKSQRSGCLARIARFLIWTVGILAILLFAGYIYQRQITTADFEQYPAPGQLVDVGGYSLHIHCTGQGSPTVIVDAGNGDFSSAGWGSNLRWRSSPESVPTTAQATDGAIRLPSRGLPK